jgi:hypothetical protein
VLQKLKEKLAALGHSLGVQGALHDRAVRKMKARHAGQVKAEAQAKAARDKADQLRKEAHRYLTFGSPVFDQAKGERLLRRAKRKGDKAAKFDVKAEREKTRSVFWRGRCRALAKRIAGVEDRLDQIKAQIAKFGPTVEGNHVKGGDEFERWLLCLNTAARNCAEGKRRNFYSMAGSWNVDHPLVPGEAHGERSDCSQTQTAFIKACGFPDINGEDFHGGFTGTMLRGAGRWKQVSLEHMLKARRPAVIVYGSGNGHHTEGWCPSIRDDGSFIDAMRTVGHGSDPVDPGTVHLFGSGEVERYFILAAE